MRKQQHSESTPRDEGALSASVYLWLGLVLLSVPTVKGVFHDHGWWLAIDVVLLVGVAAILGKAAVTSLVQRRRDRAPE